MIIGIAGKARSGKDTAAQYLSNAYHMKIHAFADPMKNAAVHLFGITRDMADGLDNYDREQIVPEWGISVREMLQKLGTDCMRNVFFDDFWLKRAEITINNSDPLIFSDVRFDNEAQWIQDRGGYVINILREQQTETRDHISELGIHIADFTITNNGTKLELFAELNRIMYTHILKKS